MSTVRFGFSRPVASQMGRRQQRWFCKTCRRCFAQNTLSFGFRLKKSDPGLNAKIFQLTLHNVSNREIALLNYVSEHCVRIRLDRMAKRALIFHSRMLKKCVIREAISFDGLENFAGSQYEPNNIQQAVGSDSLFVYDHNFAPLNRKGMMSPWQKNRLSEIESVEGRFNPAAIREATRDIVRRLVEKCHGKSLKLNTDQHFQYRRVLERDLADLKIEHTTVSSKDCRNYQNILFPVNHVDMMMRSRVAAFARKPISFAKTAGKMCQKYALYILQKNYMRPQFSKKLKSRPEAHLKSPAEILQISDRILKFSDIFNERSTENDLGKRMKITSGFGRAECLKSMDEMQST